MMKVNDYVGRIVTVYSGTPTLAEGAVVRVLDFDSTSKGEISFLVLPLQKEKNYVPNEFNPVAYESAVWIKLSNVKKVLDFNPPFSVLWVKIQSQVITIWMRVLKILLSKR
jgi:hypothetical protein